MNKRFNFLFTRILDAHPGASQDPKQTIYSSTQLSQRIIEDVLPRLLSPGGVFLTKALSQKLVSLMKQHFQHVSEKTDFKKKNLNSRDTFIFLIRELVQTKCVKGRIGRVFHYWTELQKKMSSSWILFPEREKIWHSGFI